MSSDPRKPLIFISYAHQDEPSGSGIKWLTYVQSFLRPALKCGVFDVWADTQMPGGTRLDLDIEQKLRDCDVAILLVSRHSTASDYIIDTELRIIREREEAGADIRFYPLLLTETPDAALGKFRDRIIRPRDAKPLYSFARHRRDQHMKAAADEIAETALAIAARRTVATMPTHARSDPRQAYIHVSHLPETAYERLVGREDELAHLDKAWSDPAVNVISLIAEGGAGKSALINEWLIRLQADSYRGVEAVLGWSFYSQGTKERATSAEQFLDWALEKLGVKSRSISATVKAEAIADVIADRKILLLLDGVEPLQHGPDGQLGQLKDDGLRMLLRRFCATAPGAGHGLIVLSSRLAIKDIDRWKFSAAPIVNIERLSEEAGAALLRDNGTWGIDRELRAASQEFGGHPLALALLASLLGETRNGDIRRRDHIRALIPSDHALHGHARRVMESYEKEWLAGKPSLLSIMRIVGLFDRPASPDCLEALRAAPAIRGMTEDVVSLEDDEWRRSVARLQEARLLAPRAQADPDAIDAHPLVREWFGESFRSVDEAAWKAAHGRLYEYLRDRTKESDKSTLTELAPLYQAITHGCRSGRHQQVFDEVLIKRICRKDDDGELDWYAFSKLGAIGTNLSAISWFFDKPFKIPVTALRPVDQSWIISEASFGLYRQARLTEAIPAFEFVLKVREDAKQWLHAAIAAGNLSAAELASGNVPTSVASAKKSVLYAECSRDLRQMIASLLVYADALHAAGDRMTARQLFTRAELYQARAQPFLPILYAIGGFHYCDLILSEEYYIDVLNRATLGLQLARSEGWLIESAMDTLTLGRVNHGSAAIAEGEALIKHTVAALACFNEAVDGVLVSGQLLYLPRAMLARAGFRRSVGDWNGSERDLDEASEVAKLGPARLNLCDIALESARLDFARIEAFAPLNGVIASEPPKPTFPTSAEAAVLTKQAHEHLDVARKLIAECSYRRREEELAELYDVAGGSRRFADLPLRV